MALDRSKIETMTEHLFRDTYQEVFSSLIIKFGIQHMDLIEDALQETFYKALKSWSHDRFPEKPKGWLFTVAKNQIINGLKRKAKKVPFDTADITVEADSVITNEDDQLVLLFACSRLKIKEQAKLIFSLKAICGFGIGEIANGLLISEENAYKQLQRTKKKLQQLPKSYFKSRNLSRFSKDDVSYVEAIIYFMFNEGYDSINTDSKKAINKDICFEALRLGHLLEKKFKKETTVHLLALTYFHMARFDSRINVNGAFVSLRNQDRGKWDYKMVEMGFHYLCRPKVLNRYYLEALIASNHLQAKTFSETNWENILKLYDSLRLLHDSAILRLNRALCLFELKRDEQALKELNEIKETLEHSYIYYSVSMAEYLEDKDPSLSKYWYEKSLKNTKQEFRKKLITSKLAKL